MGKNENYISIREYARRRGCSDSAVHKARRAGHLKPDAFAWDAKRKKRIGIYPDRADAQWARNFDPVKTKNRELAANIMGRSAEPEPEATPPGLGAGGGKQGGPSKADAQRYEAVWKAKERELKYRKLAGELVEKDKVYRQLFAAGQQIRTRLQSIPDRMIDDILAAPTRNEAHQLLFDAIADALEDLTTINEIELTAA